MLVQVAVSLALCGTGTNYVVIIENNLDESIAVHLDEDNVFEMPPCSVRGTRVLDGPSGRSIDVKVRDERGLLLDPSVEITRQLDRDLVLAGLVISVRPRVRPEACPPELTPAR